MNFVKKRWQGFLTVCLLLVLAAIGSTAQQGGTNQNAAGGGVSLSPGSAQTILPSANVVPLTIQNAVGSTADIADFRNNTGVLVAGVVPNGGTVPQGTVGSVIFGGNLVVSQGDFPNGATDVVFGNTSGFGNGTAGTGMTTTLIGTGSGPATPQTVVQYLRVNVKGTTYWMPLLQ